MQTDDQVASQTWLEELILSVEDSYLVVVLFYQASCYYQTQNKKSFFILGNTIILISDHFLVRRHILYLLEFEALKKFILEEMRMHDNLNYQPVMIRTLIQNNGKATKEEIKFQLHKANTEHPIEYFSDSPVFDVLTKSHPVAEFIESEKSYRLLDFESYSVPQKAVIVRYCNQKIEKNPNKCIVFGPHTNIDLFEKARSLGCYKVLARSRFFEELPSLI